MDWLQSLTKNNPLLGADANAMRKYLAQMNADADVGLSYRGLGEDAYSNIMLSKTYDDDPTNDNLEYVLGPLRYVAAGPGVPRGGAIINAGQGFGDQTMTGFVGSNGRVIHDGSKYGMNFNPKWNYNYINKFADKLKFQEDFANDPLFEYYEGRKLPVARPRKIGGSVSPELYKYIDGGDEMDPDMYKDVTDPYFAPGGAFNKPELTKEQKLKAKRFSTFQVRSTKLVTRKVSSKRDGWQNKERLSGLPFSI